MSRDQQNSSAVRNPPSAVPRRAAPTLDSVTTIAADGSRRNVEPADVRGRFTTARRWSGWALIAFYLVLPWIPVNGHPAVFIDVGSGRFHFFGFTLAAQDTWLLFFGVSGLGFALFFITALFGRVWCGWMCPQTVYLDHVYRRIERWIDGDATARRALRAAPLEGSKLARRVVKHALYIIVSLLITHLFLSYFVSLPELWSFMRESPSEHWTAFVFVFAAAGILYFNFAWFREQLCIVICPYGRLQSALSDDHSMIIGYDARRGEPRSRLRREHGAGNQEQGVQKNHSTGSSLPAPGSLLRASPGACVDCNRCVQVCPTGIDIRQGLQLECIGCAACIDACDEVMTRVQRPTGLIRYDSFAALGGGRTRWFRPRTLLYGVLLLVGVAVATFAFSTVKPTSFLVYRMSGAAYFVDRSDVRNQFLVRLVNKLSAPAPLVVRVEGLPPGVHVTGASGAVTLAPLAEQVTPLVLALDRQAYTGPFHFTVTVEDAAGSYHLSRDVEFLGPDPKLLTEEDRDHGITR